MRKAHQNQTQHLVLGLAAEEVQQIHQKMKMESFVQSEWKETSFEILH